MLDTRQIDIRAWYAGQALGGILAHPASPAQSSGQSEGAFLARITENAFRIADAMLKHARSHPKEVSLLQVRRGQHGTEVAPFEVEGPLFTDMEITQALTAGGEDGIFEGLILRGLLDE